MADRWTELDQQVQARREQLARRRIPVDIAPTFKDAARKASKGNRTIEGIYGYIEEHAPPEIVAGVCSVQTRGGTVTVVCANQAARHYVDAWIRNHRGQLRDAAKAAVRTIRTKA